MNTRRISVGVVTACLILGAGWFAYQEREHLIDYVQSASKPAVPAAKPASDFVTPATSTAKKTLNVIATSSKKIVPKGVATSTPIVSIPASLNLAVPFALQAPYQNWAQPYEDACEEASSLMVDAFYSNLKFTGPADIDTHLKALFAWEDVNFGSNQNTTAAQTAQMIREYFGYTRVDLVQNFTADDVRKAITAGHPVIIPADGKLLNNPNFKNGGPVYHMLVIKGFLSTKSFIANDPGTRKGADYVYDVSVIMNAAHDWNGGDTAHGNRVMIVVYPH